MKYKAILAFFGLFVWSVMAVPYDDSEPEGVFVRSRRHSLAEALDLAACSGLKQEYIPIVGRSQEDRKCGGTRFIEKVLGFGVTHAQEARINHSEHKRSASHYE